MKIQDNSWPITIIIIINIIVFYTIISILQPENNNIILIFSALLSISILEILITNTFIKHFNNTIDIKNFLKEISEQKKN